MSKTYTGWKVLLWFIAAYHALLGLLLMFSGELTIKAIKTVAGVAITGSPLLGVVGEILACYLLAFALIMAVAAWNPQKNRAAISVGLVLFALRLFQRICFAEKTMQIMQIPPVKYWSAAAIVAILAGLMGIFRWQLYRDMHDPASSSDSA
jgi:hypothetical protein